ncbi:MAG: hypothetical protein WBC44_06895 [Planctomycetaceae bacterium]
MDDFEEDEEEVEILIEPREEVLQQHGITIEAFEEALADAIDEYHEQVDRLGDDEDVPGVGEMTVRVKDREFRLDELAEVHVSDESE